MAFEKNHFNILVGTKEIEMRLGVIKKHFPELMTNKEIQEERLWSEKLIINDLIDQSLISKNEPSIVTDVFQIGVSEGGISFISKKNKIDQLLYLYEQLSKMVKGTYNLITGFGYPLPSIETEENSQQLYRNVSDSLENLEIYMAKGSLDELPKKMVKIVEKR